MLPRSATWQSQLEPVFAIRAKLYLSAVAFQLFLRCPVPRNRIVEHNCLIIALHFASNIQHFCVWTSSSEGRETFVPFDTSEWSVITRRSKRQWKVCVLRACYHCSKVSTRAPANSLYLGCKEALTSTAQVSSSLLPQILATNAANFTVTFPQRAQPKFS